MPAYNTIPPSLNSVPRPSTTVVEKPLEVTTRTGMSTGKRSQRRVLGADCMIAHYDREIACLHITKVNVRALPVATMVACDFRGVVSSEMLETRLAAVIARRFYFAVSRKRFSTFSVISVSPSLGKVFSTL